VQVSLAVKSAYEDDNEIPFTKLHLNSPMRPISASLHWSLLLKIGQLANKSGWVRKFPRLLAPY
jgi:hypothetical protein